MDPQSYKYLLVVDSRNQVVNQVPGIPPRTENKAQRRGIQEEFRALLRHFREEDRNRPLVDFRNSPFFKPKYEKFYQKQLKYERRHQERAIQNQMVITTAPSSILPAQQPPVDEENISQPPEERGYFSEKPQPMETEGNETPLKTQGVVHSESLEELKLKTKIAELEIEVSKLNLKLLEANKEKESAIATAEEVRKDLNNRIERNRRLEKSRREAQNQDLQNKEDLKKTLTEEASKYRGLLHTERQQNEELRRRLEETQRVRDQAIRDRESFNLINLNHPTNRQLQEAIDQRNERIVSLEADLDEKTRELENQRQRNIHLKQRTDELRVQFGRHERDLASMKHWVTQILNRDLKDASVQTEEAGIRLAETSTQTLPEVDEAPWSPNSLDKEVKFYKGALHKQNCLSLKKGKKGMKTRGDELFGSTQEENDAADRDLDRESTWIDHPVTPERSRRPHELEDPSRKRSLPEIVQLEPDDVAGSITNEMENEEPTPAQKSDLAKHADTIPPKKKQKKAPKEVTNEDEKSPIIEIVLD